MERWRQNIDEFITLAIKHDVQMIMVGGGAVQFHGFVRNSFDIDFWINPTTENFDNLIKVFQDMGYEIDEFPKAVLEQRQNISIKFAPLDLDLELITNFSVNKSFEEAYKSAELLRNNTNDPVSKVLALDDLIISKIKAGRPKDLLDVQELKKVNNIDISHDLKKSKKKGRGRSL